MTTTTRPRIRHAPTDRFPDRFAVDAPGLEVKLHGMRQCQSCRRNIDLEQWHIIEDRGGTMVVTHRECPPKRRTAAQSAG